MANACVNMLNDRMHLRETYTIRDESESHRTMKQSYSSMAFHLRCIMFHNKKLA